MLSLLDAHSADEFNRESFLHCAEPLLKISCIISSSIVPSFSKRSQNFNLIIPDVSEFPLHNSADVMLDGHMIDEVLVRVAL